MDFAVFSSNGIGGFEVVGESLAEEKKSGSTSPAANWPEKQQVGFAVFETILTKLPDGI